MVGELADEIGLLTDAEITARIAQVTAALRDAHTSSSWGAAEIAVFPVSFDWFTDGLFVVRAAADQRDAIGSRVVEIGGLPGAEIIEPLPHAAPLIREALAEYTHIEHVLPALGYGTEQLDALRDSIAGAPLDAVVSGTPIDLAALIDVPFPVIRARYEYEDTGEPSLATVLDEALAGLLPEVTDAEEA